MTVKIKIDDGKVFVKSPFHPAEPQRAKNIGGKWNGVEWMYDERDLDRVKKLYIDIFGTDGSPCELVDVRITIPEDDYISCLNQGIYIYGREVARAYSRDSGAKIGDGVVVINEGGFNSGGSMKNWRTESSKGIIFEIRDLPGAIVERGFACYGDPDIGAEVEIIRQSKVDAEALTAEKNELLKRIAEIDAKLKKGLE